MTTSTDTTRQFLHPDAVAVRYFAVGARMLASGSVATIDYAGKVVEILPAAEWEALTEGGDPFAEPRCCVICDGAGHAYPVGYEVDAAGNDVQMLTGGGPCPLEDRGYADGADGIWR